MYDHWHRDRSGPKPPDHFARIRCETLQGFWGEARWRKSAGHQTAHRDDLWSHSIGFVDLDEPAWVLLGVTAAKTSPTTCPEGSDPEHWAAFLTLHRSRLGRGKLFGPKPR